jgi:hypothetical protein
MYQKMFAYFFIALEWMNEWNVYSLKFVAFINENRNGYIVIGHVMIKWKENVHEHLG